MVLVTGGAGFIGSELVRQLRSGGRRVVVVDNLVNGRLANLEALIGESVEFYIEDIRDTEKISKLLAGVDVVFHLACLGVRHSIHSPCENHEVNATATLRLLSACRDAGVQRFVYVSSSEVYGSARRVPMGENHPTFPMTVYGASKLAGECYTRAFHRTYSYATVVVRPFNTYGPRSHHEGDTGEVIPKFMLRCMVGRPLVIFGDGTQTRDFTYVSDTARGILLAGFSEKAIGRTLNLGQGMEVSINKLAEQVARVVGAEGIGIERVGARPGDVLRLYADSTQAQELLGFFPKVGLSEGLRKLKRWYDGLDEPPEHLLEDEIIRNWESDS